MTKLEPGMAVQTPLGKGVLREVRKNGRVTVLIGDRLVVVDAGNVRPREPAARQVSRKVSGTVSGKVSGTVSGKVSGQRSAPPPAPDDDRRPPPRPPAAVDLHGLVVADAMAQVLAALDTAIRAGHERLRIVHGRSGGRLRAALHRQLREVPAVRAFRLDPANDGVTIVEI
jgi:hypothetical protein